ncbi:uncharacterized protein LOC133198208 [Saccostrea echinata]|uniref:uncharacterized protein LOC133198208 n=1 Tax=Saccostrea echinata TaxID=191078 RepID=UPI002A81D1BC|nr:uncharacterized protein LOC133198208 [Saccostrea echinata]
MAAIAGEVDLTGDQTFQVLIVDNNDPMLPTKRRIRTSLSIFRAYLLEKDLDQSIEEAYSSEQLNNLLTNFYLEMKKADGQHYAGTSVISIRYGLQKHFLELRNEDIVRNENYSTSNKMFKEVLTKLKKEGLEFPKQRISIHPDDVAKLYKTVFSADTPKGLQQKTIFEFIYYFCDRGREHLRRVRKDDFTFCRDASGREYVTVKERYTKKKSRDKQGKTIMPVRMYDHPGDPMCPVASFKKYLMKLNPINPYFWQRPRRICYHSDSIWYENSALGKNTLSALMMNLSAEAKLSKKYSNSCIRATYIPTLDIQPEEPCVMSAIVGCEIDQSVNSSTLIANKKCEEPDIQCKNPPMKTFRNDAPASSDLGHQDSCVNCHYETGIPIRNEYRNILIGEAAIAWKQLIGRFNWLPDSEIAKHLVEVHEVYCMSKGFCPLERKHDTQDSGSIYRTRKSDVITTRESEEKEDMSLQLEVEEAVDSVDDDSSCDSDLDLQSEEEIEVKEEPIYTIDNNSQNPGSAQQAENRVPHTNQESVISGGDNLFHTSTVVKQEPVDSYSDVMNTAVTNVNSSASFKLASSGALSIPPSVTSDPAMRSSFTSSNIDGSPSTHFQNSVGSLQVIGNQTVNTKTSVNVAQTPLLSTLITKRTLNSGTIEANQVQRSLPLRLNSAQGVINVNPQTDLSSSGQRGSTLYIQRGNTPNSVLVRPQNSGLFQPATLNLLTTSEIQSSPGREGFRVLPNLGQPSFIPCQPVFTSPASAFSLIKGGQETSSASSKTLIKKEQQTSPASGVIFVNGRQHVSPSKNVTLITGGQQILPASGVIKGGHQASPVSGVGGQHISPASGVTLIKGGQQAAPVSGVGGQHVSPASGVTLIKGGQQAAPVSGVGGQHVSPASGVTLIKGGQQASPVSGVGGQHVSPASGVTLIKGGQQASPVSGVGGQQASPVSGVGGQHISPASGVTLIKGGQQASPVSGVGGHQASPVSGVGGQHISPASGVTLIKGGQQASPVSGVGGHQASPVSGVGGQHISPASGVTLIKGGQQASPVSGVGGHQAAPVSGVGGQHVSPASGVTLIKGGQQAAPVSGVGGQHISPASCLLLLTGDQQASPSPGILIIKGEEQTSSCSFGLDSQTGLQQVENGQEQIEKV